MSSRDGGELDEDLSGGFARGGWLVPYADDVMGEIVDGAHPGRVRRGSIDVVDGREVVTLGDGPASS